MRKWLYINILFIFIFPNLANAAGKDDSTMILWTTHLTPFADYLDIKLLARNRSDEPIQLEFPTSKLYDFSVLNENHKEVFRFSKGKYYLQALQYVRLKSGEEKVWKIKWDYKNKGKRMEPGTYTLVASLLPIKVNGIPNSEQLVAKQTFIVPALHNVQIDGKSGKYIISGNIGQKQENFYFTVDDGHQIILDKQPIKIPNNKQAFTFSLTIPLGKTSQNESLIFSIYNSQDQPIFIQDLKK